MTSDFASDDVKKNGKGISLAHPRETFKSLAELSLANSCMVARPGTSK